MKACASHLACTFTDIFNRSLAQSTVPVCFKATTIIPIPKKSIITCMNDYRPIALTPIGMKCFERLILSHIKRSLSSTLDPHQSTCHANRSTDDTVSLTIYTAFNHLDSTNTYVRMLQLWQKSINHPFQTHPEAEHTEQSTCSKPEGIQNGIIKEPPSVKDYYARGRTVEYKCSEGYVFENEDSARCVGPHWTYPKCIQLTCEIPRDEHVYFPYYYFGGDRRQGVRKSYRCESGYRKAAEEATCTKNGWVPKPLCTEQSTCSKPEGIQNGIIKEPPSVEDYYAKGRTVEYTCSEGYVFENEDSARCVGPHWTYPKCIPTTEHCSQPPSIPDAVLDFKYRYEDGERLRLDCPAYYVQEGDQYLTCQGGRWIGNGKCLKPCTVDVQLALLQ
ncbi:hypothetical protein NFI96_005909 [Prochilodus magdalenae]|nr:hypothetical protein NFI96_005909 [Prochilodus magdalenae]